jgi:RNA-directed DNA polymerase
MVAWQYSYGRILRKLLKAGVLDSNHFTPGEIGVPQAGVLSPCLANACLDGLEKALGSIKRIFVRYADDFIITGNSQEQLEQAKKVVTDFASRGINLDKTKITKVAQGFDFLGYPDKGRKVKTKVYSL